MGCLELLAKFDPFLQQHISTPGNLGKGHVSYLSSTICDEFIEILASSVHSKIVNAIQAAKYYGLSIDSTPDIAHIDQLTIVLRYCLSNGSVFERFLGFIPIEHHDGHYLFQMVNNFLQENALEIGNCRSQCYDNARNMSSIYSGVQSRFRQVNKFAEWVPCAGHSLNLIGSTTAECCLHAVKYFGILQSIYMFLSASPQRWCYFLENM